MPLNKKIMTGAARYRQQNSLFRAPVLVLQIEWQTIGMRPSRAEGPLAPYVIDTCWRDARVEDLNLTFIKGPVHS
jgi:hypothetical protein